MASGWKFSVTVPSWTQTTLEGDELVVFYRVEVKVLPPEKNGLPRTRSVLRRYNHFTKLHSKLVQELGQKSMLGKEAPAKRLLFNVNKRPELIERRRKELQQWLWRLISDPDVAKAKNLNDFLELSDAARLVQRVTAPSSSAEPPESVVEGSYGMSEGSSPRGDASSEISGFTAASMLTDRAPSTRGPTPAADLAMDRSIAEGSRRVEQPQASTSGALDGVIGEEGPNLRLGMRIEQRGNVKRLVRALKQRLDAASLDLQEAVETMYAEKEAKRQLAEKVAQLESRMNVNHTQREAELERLLQQERQAAAGLRTGLEEAAGKQEDLRAELEDLRAAAVAAEAASVDLASQPEPPASQGNLEMVAELEQRHAEETARLSQQLREADQRAEAADTARSSASDQADAAKQEALAAEELLAATKTKSKADMKLLAKEVKSLRKQLSEALQRAESSEAAAAAATAQAQKAHAAAAAAQADQARAAAAAAQAERARAAQADQARATAAKAEEARAAVAAAEAQSSSSRAAVSLPVPPAAAPRPQQLEPLQPLQGAAVGQASPALPNRAASEAREAPTGRSAETVSDAEIAASQPSAEAASGVLQQHDQPATSGSTAWQEAGQSPGYSMEAAAVSGPGPEPAAAGHVIQAAQATASQQQAAERAAVDPPQRSGGAASAATQSPEHNLEERSWRESPQDSIAAVTGAEVAMDANAPAFSEERLTGASSLAEIHDERQLVNEEADPGLSYPAAELSVPASSATAASAPEIDSSTAEEAMSRLAESPRPQQTATAVAGQEQQDRGSSSLATLSGHISQEAGTGQPVDSHAEQPSAGSLQRAREPAAEHAGNLPEAAAAGQPTAESLLAGGSAAEAGAAGHSRQSPAEDPFGASGSVSLFSGLDLVAADPVNSGSLAQQPSNSLAQQPTPEATSGPDTEAVRAAEEPLGEAGPVQRDSLEGLDMQGLEDEMLEENSLAELGHVPGNHRLHSVISSRRSSDLLSWASESGGQDAVAVDSPSHLPRRPSSTAATGRLRSVPEHGPAAAVAPPHPPEAPGAPGTPDAQAAHSQPASQSATAEAATGEAVERPVSQVPDSAWAPAPVAALAAGVDPGARPSAGGQPGGSAAAHPVQFGNGGGTAAGSPQQAAAKRPAAAPTRAGPSAGPGSRGAGGGRQAGNQPPHPAASRAMGSFMTKMGFGGPAAPPVSNAGGATAEQQPAAGVAAGLQGMFGGRDKLESFARGLIRKSAGKAEDPDA